MRDAILGLVNPLIALIIATTFFAIWLKDRQRSEVFAFALAYVALGIGFLWSQLAPLDAGRVLLNLTNIPYFAGTWLIAWGATKRVGSSVSAPLMLIIGIIGAALLIPNHVFDAYTNVQLYISNTVYGLMFMLAAQATAARRKDNIANEVVFWMLAVTSVQFFVRPSIAFMIEGALPYEGYHQSIYYSILNAVVAVNSLGLAIALVTACVFDRFNEEREVNTRDPLSGLLSRRPFETAVDEAFARSEQENVPLSLVVGDLDHFKQVNDLWGHQAGDRAISEFGQMLAGTVRDCDVVGRIGGEEFCLLVWDADEEIAARLAERLRIKTTYLQIAEDRLDVRLTASFGVAERRPAEDYRSLFNRTDKALYQAKQNDRNCVVCAESSGGDEAKQTETIEAIETRSAEAG